MYSFFCEFVNEATTVTFVGIWQSNNLIQSGIESQEIHKIINALRKEYFDK
jgi:hypothetical protein